MERRTKLITLIIVAATLLLLGIAYLVYLFVPLVKTGEQPPALPDTVTPTSTPFAPTSRPAVGGPITSPVPPDVKRIQDLAGIVVARIGSGASGEGFRGYADVMVNATPAYRTKLQAEQADMQKSHPGSGPAYGVVTRVVSIDGSRAKSGAETLTFVVQTQRIEDAGNPAAPTSISYKEATVSFERQADKNYLLNNIVWKDIQR